MWVAEKLDWKRLKIKKSVGDREIMSDGPTEGWNGLTSALEGVGGQVHALTARKETLYLPYRKLVGPTAGMDQYVIPPVYRD
jgi:hypothetical protein